MEHRADGEIEHLHGGFHVRSLPRSSAVRDGLGRCCQCKAQEAQLEKSACMDERSVARGAVYAMQSWMKWGVVLGHWLQATHRRRQFGTPMPTWCARGADPKRSALISRGVGRRVTELSGIAAPDSAVLYQEVCPCGAFAAAAFRSAVSAVSTRRCMLRFQAARVIRERPLGYWMPMGCNPQECRSASVVASQVR